MKIIEIKNKEDRKLHPNLYTLAELKRKGLEPRPRVKERGIYYWFAPGSYKKESALLYDIELTQKRKRTEKEKAQRRRAYEKAKQKDKRKKILEKIGNIEPCQKVIFDTETTGLDFEKDEILQFSAINEKGEILLNTYIKPTNKKAWKEAEKVNHITPEMVKNCKTIDELCEDIQRILLSANELIAYNIDFDLNMLAKYGFKIPDVYCSDVMIEFAEIYGEYNEKYGHYKWQKLTTCAAYYGYEFKAHDSLEDVKATLYCYNKIRENN